MRISHNFGTISTIVTNPGLLHAEFLNDTSIVVTIFTMNLVVTANMGDFQTKNVTNCGKSP